MLLVDGGQKNKKATSPVRSACHGIARLFTYFYTVVLYIDRHVQENWGSAESTSCHAHAHACAQTQNSSNDDRAVHPPHHADHADDEIGASATLLPLPPSWSPPPPSRVRSNSSSDEYVRSATPTKNASLCGVNEMPAISPNRSICVRCVSSVRVCACESAERVCVRAERVCACARVKVPRECACVLRECASVCV
jgi:hypothetical protein